MSNGILKMGTLTLGVVIFVITRIIIDTSLNSKEERAKYRHFRKLEERSKDTWLARSQRRIARDRYW